MNENLIKSINKQNPLDLYNTYNDIINTIKLLESNIKEIPTKETEEEKKDAK